MRALVLTLAVAAPARAAVVQALDLAELCHDATRIVQGTVVGEASAWRDGRIITHVTVSVRRTLKGPPAKTVMVSRLECPVVQISTMRSSSIVSPALAVFGAVRRSPSLPTGAIRTGHRGRSAKSLLLAVALGGATPAAAQFSGSLSVHSQDRFRGHSSAGCGQNPMR